MWRRARRRIRGGSSGRTCEGRLRPDPLLGAARWCELHCGKRSTVETIQVVLDAKLLKAADAAAKRHKVNRSALIRRALHEHLRRLHELELEEQDRRGYMARPQRPKEYRVWEEAAAWPADSA